MVAEGGSLRRVPPRLDRQGGFSRFEMALAIVFILVLVVVAYNRMWALRVAAEQAAVTRVVAGIRSALGLQMAQRVARGGIREVAGLADTNPVELLLRPPAAYVGEFASETTVSARPGEWYYLREGGYLVYRVRFPGEFESPLAGPPRLRFRLRLSFDDRDGDGRFGPGEALYGIDLVVADPYRWPGFVR